MPNEPIREKWYLGRLLPNLTSLFLAAIGSTILAWVGWLTWYDMTTWGKDIALIFLGSRTGEAIGLGIGMKVIHYFLIGLVLFLSGLFTFLLRRSKASKDYREKPLAKLLIKEGNARILEEKIFSGCLHQFGYLSSRPKDTPIPQECILCQRLGDCMVATVYIENEKEGD